MIFTLFSVYLKFYFIFSVFEGELADTVPVVHVSLAGCRIIGRMCVGMLTFCPNLFSCCHLKPSIICLGKPFIVVPQTSVLSIIYFIQFNGSGCFYNSLNSINK